MVAEIRDKDNLAVVHRMLEKRGLTSTQSGHGTAHRPQVRALCFGLLETVAGESTLDPGRRGQGRKWACRCLELNCLELS